MEETIGFKARLFSMILRLMTLTLIAVALYISVEGIFVVLLLFVLVVPFEKLFPRHKGQKIRRPHLDTDIGYALASPLLGLLTGFGGIGVGLLSLAWIRGVWLRPYVEQIPEEYMPLIGILCSICSSIGRIDFIMKFQFFGNSMPFITQQSILIGRVDFVDILWMAPSLHRRLYFWYPLDFRLN